jgi:predicted glycosyl hydrolase (DUF1957 family)
MDFCYLLHFYQPLFTERQFLERIYKESYEQIFRILRENPLVKIAVNIPAVTLLRYREEQVGDLAGELQFFVERGQIELMATSFAHTLLPFASTLQARRQVERHMEVTRELLDLPNYQFRSFYPPEMMLDQRTVDMLKQLNLENIICSSNSIPDYTTDVKRYIYSDLKIYPRSLLLSRVFENNKVTTGEQYWGEIDAQKVQKDRFYLIAHDAETVGHHYEGTKVKLFEDLATDSGLRWLLPSELESMNLRSEHIDTVIRSSWEKTKIRGKELDPHWNNPKNLVHQYQWKLTNKIVALVESLKGRTDKYEQFQETLDQLQYSCQYWWASSYPFWHPGIVREAAWNWFRFANTLFTENRDHFDIKSEREILVYYSRLLKYLAKYDTNGWSRKNIDYYDRVLHKLKRTYKI